MNSKRPVMITAAEFVAGDYAAKIARGECVVKDFGQAIKTIIKSDRSLYYRVFESNGVRWKTRSDTRYIVEWLPIPPSRYADLLPQTVDTVRYGSEAFEQLAREDAEAEIARLQAERDALQAVLTKVRKEIAQLKRLVEAADNLAALEEPDHR